MSSPSPELKNKIVRAGAGAGKTTTLVGTVIDFVQSFKSSNGRFPRIVLTTFTRKATQELRERITSKAEELGDQELLDYALSKSELFISTIHGVLSLYLNRFSYKMEMDSAFQMQNFSDRLIEAKIIVKTLLESNDSYAELLESFNLFDLTRMLLEFDSEYLHNKDISSFGFEDMDSFAIEKFNELCSDSRNLANDIEGEKLSASWLKSMEILKEVSNLPNYSEIQERYDKKLFAAPRVGKTSEVDPLLLENTKKILSGLKEFLEPQYSKEFFKSSARLFNVFFSLGEEFSKALWAQRALSGLLTFSDLENVSAELSRQSQVSHESFSSEWDYWLIDEFQDTSPRQLELLETLIGKKPFFLVGDPQQSIYLFRGARETVFKGKFDKLRGTGEITEKLSTNYRSKPELLEFFNDVFQGFGKDFERMEPHSNVENPEDIVCELTQLEDIDREIRCLRNRCIRLLNTGVSPESIAVLTKQNKEAEKIDAEFRKAGIPTQLNAKGGFAERREIIDLCQILKVLINPFDDVSLVGVLRGPWFKISDKELMEHSRRKSSLWEAIRDSESVSDLKSYMSLSKQIGLTETLIHIIKDRKIAVTSLGLDPTGRREANIQKFVSLLKLNDHRVGFHYLHFLNQLDGQLAQDDEDGDAVSSLLPNRVNIMTIHKSKGLQFDHVFIPHLNRGIERKAVNGFIFDERHQKFGFPTPLPGEDGKNEKVPLLRDWLDTCFEWELSEQKRLFYVALTRAKKKVYLSRFEKLDKNSVLPLLNLNWNDETTKTDNYTYVSLKEPDEVELTSRIYHKPPGKKALEWNFKDKRVSIDSVTRHLGAMNKKGGEVSGNLLRSEKAVFGIQVHSILERMSHHLKSGSEIQFGNEFTDYVLSIEDFPMTEILKIGRPEWSYLLNEGDKIVQGTVDIWADIDGERWVVDYKTGSEAFKDKAFLQLAEYARALNEYRRMEKVNLIALFPIQKKFYQKIWAGI